MENQKRSTLTMPFANSGEKFVDPTVFLAEITSRRELVRSDQDGATIRGLLDPTTGQRILIEEERLLNARKTG